MINLDEELKEHLEKAIKDFRGSATTLESALGAVLIGQTFGWRMLKMIHNPSTYSKYEKILGIKFRDYCKEETKNTQRNVGMKAAVKLKAFWEIVRGTLHVKDKGHIK